MKRLAKAIAAVAIAGTMCTTVGFAATTPNSEHPTMDHGTAGKAQVSEEIDTALNVNPNMGTKFTVYLAPDIPKAIPIVHEIPKMGDLGIDQKTLLEALVIAGGCYFVSDGIAVACRKRKTEPELEPEAVMA